MKYTLFRTTLLSVVATLFSATLFLAAPWLASAETINLSSFTKLVGEAANDQSSMAMVAGDFNNDGFDDIAIGAPYDDTTGTDGGAVYIFYGDDVDAAPTGTIDLSTADAKLRSEAAGDYVGTSLDSGDFNADGYDDLVIGAPGESSVTAGAGAAYIVYGKSDQFTSISLEDANTKIFGLTASDSAGAAVASVGDVNGDTYHDIIIGAAGRDDGGPSSGAAYLIYGETSGIIDTTLSSADVIFTGENENDFAGYSVDGAGDINGDDYDDVIIGAYGDNAGANDAGAAYIMYGGTGDTALSSIDLASADVKVTGEAASDAAGWQVRGGGDVNADGYDDMLISAYLEDTGGTNAGAVYVVYGQADAHASGSLSSAVKFLGETAGDEAGYSISLDGDINGDGYADMVIGAIYDDSNATDAGSAYVVYGQADNFTTMDLSFADVMVQGNAANDNLGTMVSVGDINGDRMSDLILGAIGEDAGGTSAGAGYIGYINIDRDEDGVAGDSGIIEGTDCNDNDNAVSEDQTYYQDSDTDGFGNPAATSVVCSATAPSGYVNNSGDLDDTDETITVGTISSFSVSVGEVTVTYESGYSHVIVPYQSTTAIRAAASTDGTQLVVTNGKSIKVLEVGITQTTKEIFNKRTKRAERMKLKVASMFDDYDTVLFVSERGTRGRVVVLRLKPNHTLTKKKTKLLDLLTSNPTTLRLKIAAANKRFTTQFGAKANMVKHKWQVKSNGTVAKVTE